MRRVEIADWPGTTRKVGVLYLSSGELQDAHRDALAWLEKQGIAASGFNSEQVDREVSHQQVWRMVVDPDARASFERHRVFRDAAEVRARCSTNMLAHFAGVQLQMTAEELMEWRGGGSMLDQIAEMFGIAADDPLQLIDQLKLIAARVRDG